MNPRRIAACLIAIAGAAPLGFGIPGASAKPEAAAQRAKTSSSSKDDGEFRWCRLQKPQDFLKRTSFVRKGSLNGAKHNKALKYRLEHYGWIPGLEDSDAPGGAYSFARGVTFMGLPLQIHEKVVPALRCVERRIKKTCRDSDERYTARAVGGFRRDNTYRGGEVSNHLFGIAIDIDPDRNPCCGCVDPWPSHKLCRDPSRDIYEKTELPRCWINAFERYGFYWLGRDTLEDTMHFEFLGDPDRILPPP